MTRNRILFLAPFNYLLILSFLVIISCDVSENKIDIKEPLVETYKEDLSFKVVGHLPFYRLSLVDNINYDWVTYANLGFRNLDASGNLVVGNGVAILPIVQELKVQLHAKGLAITATLIPAYLDAVITNKTLKSFDFINIVAYDNTKP